MCSGELSGCFFELFRAHRTEDPWRENFDNFLRNFGDSFDATLSLKYRWHYGQFIQVRKAMNVYEHEMCFWSFVWLVLWEAFVELLSLCVNFNSLQFSFDRTWQRNYWRENVTHFSNSTHHTASPKSPYGRRSFLNINRFGFSKFEKSFRESD